MQGKESSQALLIKQLNPVISGWGNYHRHAVAKHTFKVLDNFIFGRLWSWARRRHTRQSASWIKKRYFHVVNKVQWTFCCKKSAVTLRKAQTIPIRRHIKIKGAANPYDPMWFKYFEKDLACFKSPLKPATLEGLSTGAVCRETCTYGSLGSQ